MRKQKGKSKFYKVYINYEMTGELIVKADSSEEAEEIASEMIELHEFPGVVNPEMVSGTMTVLHDVSEKIS